MSSSESGGPDAGPALIRISTTQIHTQVTQTVRFRPVRSLLLLALLVVVSLFVLFTLSQMAVVQHTMMAQLGETGRAGVGVGTMGGGGSSSSISSSSTGGGGGGGRVGRSPHRPWRSQFSQFKIEPLLIRNAPSVEVNTALAANRRRASQLAAIIVRNSLLVTHSHHNTSNPINNHVYSDRRPPHTQTTNTLPLLPRSHATVHTTHRALITTHIAAHTAYHSHVITNHSTHSISTSNHSKLKTFVPPGRQAGPHTTARDQSKETTEENGRASEGSAEPTATDRKKGTRVNSEVVRGNTKTVGGAEGGDRRNDVRQTHQQHSGKQKVSGETVRRRFLSKVQCDTLDCDTILQEHQNTLPSTEHHRLPLVHTTSHSTSSTNTNKRTRTDPQFSHNSKINKRISENEMESEELNANAKLSDLLGTEFSEAEREFEPLYMREDDDYDVTDDGLTTLTSPVPQHLQGTSKATSRAPLTEEQLRALPLCPEIPPGLHGVPHRRQTTPVCHDPKVAVVLPYRDRLHHLVILLSWLKPVLRKQQLEYTIYVAEQAGNATFNKGSIMNAGFMEAWQRSDANCFVFHDVDLLPEDDRNMYSCPPQPRHLSVGVDTLGYKLPYFLLAGGVLSVRGDHFLRLNGYSNMYWGWGGEDDDMGYRIKQSGLSITRPPSMLARYTMIRHLKRRPLTWKVRGKLVRTSGRRYRLDGLNTLRYSLLALHRHPLFTHLLLDVGSPPENLVRLDSH
nr:LOW QUALITY PROTEIN: uncharacterized protein LOC128693824 [Cherax quadricarinatus]